MEGSLAGVGGAAGFLSEEIFFFCCCCLAISCKGSSLSSSPRMSKGLAVAISGGGGREEGWRNPSLLSTAIPSWPVQNPNPRSGAVSKP